MATQSQLLKKELTAAFPSVKFSVRGDSGSIRVEYIDGPGLKEVKAIADRYSKVSRCAVSGDILSGGNTFVFVARLFSDSLKEAILDVMEADGHPRTEPDDYSNEGFWWRETFNQSRNLSCDEIMNKLHAIVKAETAEVAEDVLSPVTIAQLDVVFTNLNTGDITGGELHQYWGRFKDRKSVV